MSLFPVERDDWPADYEALFWDAVPRKVARKAAMKALAAVRKRRISWSTVLNGMIRYAAAKAGSEPRFILHPTTWLNGDRWEDEEQNGQRSRTLADATRDLIAEAEEFEGQGGPIIDHEPIGSGPRR